MCGIAGYVGLDDEPLLRRMCASVAHRGPDDDGYFLAPGVGLSMRRLSVIDLRTGHQPIGNETGEIQVVFNGEIYNYQELTQRLRQGGHKFTTTSDTETIVHLYEEEGLDFVNSLRGMFAIALWDAPRRRLVLARDRVGEKPLYYARRGTALLFGSEIKAILQMPGPRAVEPQAVCEFLAAGYVASPRTFFDGIQKLAPGHMLICQDGRVETRKYWPCGKVAGDALSFDEASERLAGLLDETVRLCLKSDVEVGAFLSGGVDSSVVVALMRKHEARVQTFSVGYTGAAAGFNELGFAQRVAHELGTDHHELILGARSSMELLPRILWHYDEPHGEPTSVLVYLLSEFTRQRVKVAVGGTGGDEVFLGYPRHAGIRLLQYYRHVPRWVRRVVVERVVAGVGESTRGGRFAKRARRFIQGAELPAEEAYLHWVSLLSRDTRERLLSGAIRAAAVEPLGEAFLREHLLGPDRGDPLDRATSLDVHGYLPEYQLAYMDRMSMAHGLEVRSPLCDFRLVEFVTSLPSGYRLHRTHTKHILKKVAARWIPAAIAERRKVGFDSPIGQWAKEDLRGFFRGFLAPAEVQRTGLLNPEAVQQLLEGHLSGRRDYSLQLWSLLALEAWHRMYIEDGVTDGTAYRLKDLRGVSAANAFTSSSSANGELVAQAAALPTGKGPLLRKRAWDRSPAPVRRLLAPVLASVSPTRLLGREFRHWRAVAEQSERWTGEQARRYQLEQVRRVCQLAYDRSPYHRARFEQAGLDPAAICSLDDLHRLPTMDRKLISEHLDDLCTVNPCGKGVDRVSTGGTQGVPMSFFIGADRSAFEYAFLVASWMRAGYRPEMPMAVLRGRIVEPDRDGLRHHYDPLLRHHHYSAFHMSEENMGRYLDHIRTIGPCFLHVYPSSVTMLARLLERTGAPAPANVRGIIAESEIVYDDQRRLVERVFGCRYFSCYGHSEKTVLAAECEKSADYHIWPAYGYFELLDGDGRSVNVPGERGEIVATGFINTAMPFIRYRTGDSAAWVSEGCAACGRAHPVLRDIRGHRIQELLVALDGSLIPWTALNMHDETFDRVQQFQFYQDAPGRAVLRIVPAGGFGDEDAASIRRALERKLDGRIQITVTSVTSIAPSPRGKGIYVDQRVANIDGASLHTIAC